MILDNLPYLFFSIALVVTVFDSMGVSARVRATMAAAGNKSLIEFTNTHGSEVMGLFSLWFGGAVSILGLLSLVVSNMYPNSLAADMLASSFLAFILCLCSICLWQHRRPIMIEQLRERALLSAANKFKLVLYLTVAALLIGAIIVGLQAGRMSTLAILIWN